MALAELPPVELAAPAQGYELPDYDAEIVEWRIDEKPPQITSHGLIQTDYVCVHDHAKDVDHTYVVVQGAPRDRITDVRRVATTALATSTHGHNRHTMYHSLDEGVPYILIGSEGVHRESGERGFNPFRHRKALGSIALSRTAYNMHLMLDELQNQRNIDTSEVHLRGKSRGAMAGMGFLAYNGWFNRRVSEAKLDAPCFPKKLELGDVPEIAKQFGLEPYEAFRLLAQLSFTQLIHYPSTIDPHPKALAFQLATIPSLTNGEAGHMGRLILPGQPIEITTYKGDFMSMAHIWDEIFSENPHYKHNRRPGTHVSLVDEITMEALQEMIAQQPDRGKNVLKKLAGRLPNFVRPVALRPA